MFSIMIIKPDKWDILTVGSWELRTLAISELSMCRFLLSFTRRNAHLHVKNRSNTPREKTKRNSMTIADPRAVNHKDRDKLISHLDRCIYDFLASVLMIKVTMNSLKEHAPLSCIIWCYAHKLRWLTKSFYPNVNTCLARYFGRH